MIIIAIPLLIIAFLAVLFVYRPRGGTLSVRNIIQNIYGSFNAYPLVIVFALLATIYAIFWIWWVDNWSKDCSEIQIALIFGVSLSYAFYLIRNVHRTFIALIVPPIVFFAYYLQKDQATFLFSVRWVQFFLLSHLLVSFIAHWQSKSQLDFWEYNKNLLISFLIASIYSCFIFVGVAIALGAIQYLFEITDADWNKTYPTIWVLSSMLIHPLIFLGVVGGRSANKQLENLTPLRTFASYVLIPIVLLYLFILFSYELKIIIASELPKGMVSWLVCSFGLAGTLTWLITYPLGSDPRGLPKLFHKRFFQLFIPLLILLCFAVYERVSAYGFTELRYLLLILTIWIFVITLLFSIRPKSQIKLIPLSLFVLIISTVYGPLSAFSVSYASQQSRLKQALFTNGCEKIAPGTLSFAQIKEISSILEYLAGNHAPETVLWLTSICQSNQDVLKVIQNAQTIKHPNEFDHTRNVMNNKYYEKYNFKWDFTSSFLGSLGLTAIREYENVTNNKDGSFYFSQKNQYDNNSYVVTNLDRFITNLSIYNKNVTVTLGPNLNLNLSLDRSVLTLNYLNKTLRLDLAEDIKKLNKNTESMYLSREIPLEDLTFEKSENGLGAKFYIHNISGKWEDEEPIISSLSMSMGFAVEQGE